jgi:hypothetical protein
MRAGTRDCIQVRPFQAYMVDCTIRNTASPQPKDSTMNSGASSADW